MRCARWLSTIMNFGVPVASAGSRSNLKKQKNTLLSMVPGNSKYATTPKTGDTARIKFNEVPSRCGCSASFRMLSHHAWDTKAYQTRKPSWHAREGVAISSLRVPKTDGRFVNVYKVRPINARAPAQVRRRSPPARSCCLISST